jgi:hypothetical protein
MRYGQWLKHSFAALKVFIGIALIGISWYLYSANASLKAKLQATADTIQLPYVISGFSPDLLSQTNEISSSLPALRPVPSENRRTLVLVSNDLCKHCLATLPFWTRLIDKVHWTQSDEVWIVSYGSAISMSPLISQLKQIRSVNYRVLLVQDRLLFQIRTGLIAVPATLVLDSEGTIRSCAIGTLNESQMDALANGLNLRDTGHANRHIFLRSPDSYATDVK